MFDHPTLKATASYIAGQLTSGSVASVSKLPDQKVEIPKTMALKVQGAACNFPGSSEFSHFSCSLWQGTDSISEMPFSRWDADEYYDPAMPTGLEMYVRHAAFLEKVEFFDAQLSALRPGTSRHQRAQRAVMANATRGGLVMLVLNDTGAARGSPGKTVEARKNLEGWNATEARSADDEFCDSGADDTVACGLAPCEKDQGQKRCPESPVLFFGKIGSAVGS